MLLGQLKEEHKPVNTTGVVPKDLGLGFFKDMIDLDDEKEARKNKRKITD
jgi:hypothetical protein